MGIFPGGILGIHFIAIYLFFSYDYPEWLCAFGMPPGFRLLALAFSAAHRIKGQLLAQRK